MRVALVSLNQVWENKNENFQACRVFVEKAKAFSADLIVFPEMTLTAFTMNTYDIAESRLNSNSLKQFQMLAQEFQIGIVFGVVFHEYDRATNNAIMVDSEGLVKGCYAKIHPFSFAGEDKFFSGGCECIVVQLDQMIIGLTVCYDLRFPEIYSALGAQCNLIINIANWPAKRLDHWNTLLKARAIENQVFMIGVNRIGIDNNALEYVKSSQVINPNGELLCPSISHDEFDIFDIDPLYAIKFKEVFSTTQDRRIDFYKAIL